MTSDPTLRFSTRVDDYVKARPAYPKEVLELLCRVGVAPGSVIADVGSGTGILTSMLLDSRYEVYAIEPNAEMRSVAEKLLGGSPRFHSIDAPAEQTTLPDASAHAITAAQAFHWFDQEKCREEFRRILRPGGWVFLMWNTRWAAASPFMRAYEELLQQYSVDYNHASHRKITDDVLQAFFAGPYETVTLPNSYSYDLDRIRSGLQSASYTPQAGDPRYEPMLRQLEAMFAEHQCDGRVTYELHTKVYYGHV